MSNAADLQTIEVSIENARKAIERKNSLERLLKNRDFKKLIKEGFFKDEPVRVTSLLAHPEYDNDENRQELHMQLYAISHLQQYFNHIRQMGAVMERQLEADERTREEILDEGLEE